MQVIFHDVQRSQWVEDYITERAGRLGRFASDITSCRVTLAQEQASRHKGNRYSVLVEVRVPPQHDLAVRKQKDIVDMPQQLPALINLAFGAVAEVRFSPEDGDEGSQASSVQLLAPPASA